MILRAQDLNISLFFIPLLWMMFNGVYTAFCLPAGKISDIVGRKKVLVAGLIVYSLVYFGFGRSSQAWHIWALFALYGAYYGITEGTSRALIADSIPAEVRATAYGIYNTMIGVSAFFSSVIMGLLWQVFGATIAFSFGGSLAAVSAILLLLFI
ncbi:MAG: MFS transporter [Candidatus Margulisiibacteriota bacterium]